MCVTSDSIAMPSNGYTSAKVGIIPYTDDGFILLGLDSRSAAKRCDAGDHLGWSLFSGLAFSRDLQTDAMHILYDKSRYAYWNRATNFYDLRKNDFTHYVQSTVTVKNQLTQYAEVVSNISIFFVRVPRRVDPEEIISHPIVCNTQAQVVNWTWVHASQLLIGPDGKIPNTVCDYKGNEIGIFIAFAQNLRDQNVQRNLQSISQRGTIDPNCIRKYEVSNNSSMLVPWDVFAAGGVTQLQRYYKHGLGFVRIGLLLYNSRGNFLLNLRHNQQNDSKHLLSCVAWSVNTSSVSIQYLASLRGPDSWHECFCQGMSKNFKQLNHKITWVIAMKNTPFLLCLVYVPEANEDAFVLGDTQFKWVRGRSLLSDGYVAESAQGEILRLFCGFSNVISSSGARICLHRIMEPMHVDDERRMFEREDLDATRLRDIEQRAKLRDLEIQDEEFMFNELKTASDKLAESRDIEQRAKLRDLEIQDEEFIFNELKTASGKLADELNSSDDEMWLGH